MTNRIRTPKVRPPQASPKEVEAWKTFTEMAEAMHAENGVMPAMVRQELDRLCRRGNPLAIRFLDSLSLAESHLRRPDEQGQDRPEIRRISRLRWIHVPTARKAR